jgi:hypothetical protein
VRYAPIVEHYENRDRSRLKKPLHQPDALDWSISR